ncbi:hypothetical protein CYMTET_28543, partial [Cymbomonas tetramitiformis]
KGANIQPIPTIASQCSNNSLPFMFVIATNLGPTFIRRQALIEIGGFDLSYSRRGEPGIGFDTEVSYRLWRHGWSSGVADCDFMNFQRGVGGRGTKSSKDPAKQKAWHRNLRNNQRKTVTRNGDIASAIGSAVKSVNSKLEQPPPGEHYYLDKYMGQSYSDDGRGRGAMS